MRVFIESDVTYIPGSKPDVKKKQAKLYKGVHTSKEGAEAKEGEWASARVFGSPEQSTEKGLFRLLITRDIEVKIQARVGTSSLPLKVKPSRSPLSAGLIPQTRYSPVPLNNRIFLPLKVTLQPMALLGQAFNRACSLGSFATGSNKQRCFITQLISSSMQLFPNCPQLVLGRLQLIHDYVKLRLGSFVAYPRPPTGHHGQPAAPP